MEPVPYQPFACVSGKKRHFFCEIPKFSIEIIDLLPLSCWFVLPKLEEYDKIRWEKIVEFAKQN